MKHTSGLGFCGWVCWLIGLVAGIAAFAMSQAAVGSIAALMVGLAVGIFAGLVLSTLFCKSAPHDAAVASDTSSAKVAAATAGAAVATGAVASSAKADDGSAAAR
ncbi:hypothetical protein, partial [Lentibacter algarum]